MVVDRTELFGEWRVWRGMKVSNLGFIHGLSKRSHFTPKHTQSADSHHQPFPDFPDTCGNPDL